MGIFTPSKTTPNRSPPKKTSERNLSIVFELFIGKLRIVARGSSTAHGFSMGDIFFQQKPFQGPAEPRQRIHHRGGWVKVQRVLFDRIIRLTNQKTVQRRRSSVCVEIFPPIFFRFKVMKGWLNQQTKIFLETFSQV